MRGCYKTVRKLTSIVNLIVTLLVKTAKSLKLEEKSLTPN
jgi:hypothetical protein